MRTTILIPLVLISGGVLAQSTLTQWGARSMAMGNVAATVSDEYALFNNIGALTSGTSGGFFATQERSALPGANRGGAGVVMRKKDLSMGAGFLRFGDAVYNEQQILLGASHRLQHTSLGIRINVVQYQAMDVPVRSALRLDIGFHSTLTRGVTFGAYVNNVSRARITASGLLPVRFIAGFGIHPTSSCSIRLETEKDLEYPMVIRMGFEYNFRSLVYFRTGFNLNPALVSLGTGFNKRLIQIDAGIHYMTLTGYAAQASLLWKIQPAARS